MTDGERMQDIREAVERAKTYTPDESATLSYWPSMYAADVAWLLARLGEGDK